MQTNTVLSSSVTKFLVKKLIFRFQQREKFESLWRLRVHTPTHTHTHPNTHTHTHIPIHTVSFLSCPRAARLLSLDVEADARFVCDNNAVLGEITRVGTLIVATIYLQLIQNRYMFRS